MPPLGIDYNRHPKLRACATDLIRCSVASASGHTVFLSLQPHLFLFLSVSLVFLSFSLLHTHTHISLPVLQCIEVKSRALYSSVFATRWVNVWRLEAVILDRLHAPPSSEASSWLPSPQKLTGVVIILFLNVFFFVSFDVSRDVNSSKKMKH